MARVSRCAAWALLAVWAAACCPVGCSAAEPHQGAEMRLLRGGGGGGGTATAAGGGGGEGGGLHDPRRQAAMLVRPAPDHLSLQVAEDGIAALEAMKGPVAPVVVIGPYRSGKSFLLNQLVGVACDEGFGVGHTRDTQTKGIWVWGAPVPREVEREGEGEGEEGASLVFMDTEGLESARRIDTYDDRIFAFSAVVSSLLIYNLAEAVRESDVAKLSFATRLGAELAGGLQPNSMLWLIQRDFLGGKSVTQMLDEALAEVPNPGNEPSLAAVNDVRHSLKSLAGTSTAFGLAQPHLERTRLCDMPDNQLAPAYVEQRDKLRSLVHRLATPKKLEGALMTGPQLAELVKQTVKILNSKKIPTVHNVLEAYNSDVVSRCIKGYTDEMDGLSFPVAEETLEAFHTQTKRKAMERLEAERFGGGSQRSGPKEVEEGAEEKEGREADDAWDGEEGDPGADELKERLLIAIRREHKAHVMTNKYESTRACERLELACEEELEVLQAMRLPSARKFDRQAASCRSRFDAGCVGPSRRTYRERISKAEARARRQFLATYNANMFQGMVVASLLVVAVFRFAVKVPLLELAGWVLFLGLEGSGQLGLGGGDLYETRAWGVLLSVWEAVVFNPLVDLERHWALLASLLAVCWLASKVLCRNGSIAWRLGLPNPARKQKRVIDQNNAVRDLDV